MSAPAPRLRSSLRAALAFLAFYGVAPHARSGQDPATIPVPNAGFETDANDDSWPDHWTQADTHISWGREEGNRFLRLVSPGPDQTVALRQELPAPAGVPALELTWRWRIDNLTPGARGCDARLTIEFLDADDRVIQPVPAAVHSRVAKTKGWIARRAAFLVPEGARTLVLTPSLIQVASGTLDLDDIALRPTDPAPIIAAAQLAEEVARARHVPREEARPERWPAPLHTEGNRLVDSQGREVWLQGLNAGGLEMVPDDPQPIKSVVVGIDEWRANVVRLPVSNGSWFGQNALQNDGGAAYRDYVDQCVLLAANRGAYLVLDLHQFRAPRAEHARFWTDAAARYKNHPAVIFDLFNEPFGTSWEVWRDGGFVSEHQGADESAFLSDAEKNQNQGFESGGMQGLLDTVRATGAKNLVVVAGLAWSYDLRGVTEGHELKDVTGNGIMYSWHAYNWHRGWEKHVLAAAAKYPILVGEVGADTKKMDFIPEADQESPYTWVPDMLGFIQQHRLNWTGWCLHPAHTPVMISDWKYTPTPFWGVFAKDALAGKKFEMQRTR